MDIEIKQRQLARARAYTDGLLTRLDQVRRQVAKHQQEIARLNKLRDSIKCESSGEVRRTEYSARRLSAPVRVASPGRLSWEVAR